MWTKEYILNPTAVEYFKTKHPIATSSMLLPLAIYYLYTRLSGINSLWILVGSLGCLVFGAGLGYLFAVIKKIYKKVYVPILALVLGSLLIVISLILA